MKRMFLSYSSEDQHYANLIRAWLKSEPDLEIDFTSLHDVTLNIHAKFSRSKILEDINAASLVVCLVRNGGPSSWQEWEIRKAVESGRPTIAISASREDRDSCALYHQLSIPIVNWTYKSLLMLLGPMDIVLSTNCLTRD